MITSGIQRNAVTNTAHAHSPILVALAGVGLATDVRAMLGVGAKPFVLGASIWIAIGLLGLGVARVYHG